MDVRQRLASAAAALVIAVVTWAWVHNLNRSPAIFQVPITFDHPEDVVKLDGHQTEVKVRVLATKPRLRSLQASELDLHVAYRGTLGREAVVLDASDVRAPFGVRVEQVEPARFPVTYDRKVTRTLGVRVDLHGQPAEGFEVDREGMVVDPPRVRMTGPASLLEGDAEVVTERLDVTDRTATLGPVRLKLVAPGPAFTLDPPGEVEVTVPVRAILARKVFEEVPVQVLRGAWRTSSPNPRTLRVTVEGPELSVRSLPSAAVLATVDASGLEPRAEDYRLEPSITVDARACPRCRVVAQSQRTVDVTVRPLRTGTRTESARGERRP